MVKKINASQFNEVTESKLAVVDFNATWCGPCRMLGPVFEEVSDELVGKADFFAVDVDENQSLAIKNGISSIPAIVLFKNGEIVDRQVGFVPKAQLVAFVERNI